MKRTSGREADENEGDNGRKNGDEKATDAVERAERSRV